VDEPAVVHGCEIEGLMTTTLSREIEHFVDADTAAEFLVITRRRVLEMARAGEIPAHAIGEGKRKMWRFRLSELAEAVVAKKPAANARNSGIINPGSPRQPNRRN
jgi:excisionase family DNA binding protein